MALSLNTDINNYLWGNSAPARKYVKCASIADINLSIFAPSSIDGVSLSEGDRVLIKDQSVSVQNGIYFISGGFFVRALDAPAGTTFAAVQVYINEGATYANGRFICSAASGQDIIGANNISFMNKKALTQINTGTGLTGGPITISGTISMANMNPYTYKSNLTTATGAPTDNLLSDLRLVLTKTFYVDNVGGLDTNSGLSFAEAFATVNKALSVLYGMDGQVILNITGSPYSFAPTVVPNNATIRFATALGIISSYNGWTSQIATGSVSSTPTTYTNYSGTVLSTSFQVTPAPSSASAITGAAMQMTSGAALGTYALIYSYQALSTAINTLGDISNVVPSDTFNIYVPPVTLFNNGNFDPGYGINSRLIFNNINFSLGAAYTYNAVRQSIIFEYSRYSNENQPAQSFLISDGSFILRNSGWSSLAPYFDFPEGNVNVEFNNSLIGYGGSIASGRLGFTANSNSKFQVDSSVILFENNTVPPWQLNSIDTSITNTFWVCPIQASNCSKISCNDNAFYTLTYGNGINESHINLSGNKFYAQNAVGSIYSTFLVSFVESNVNLNSNVFDNNLDSFSGVSSILLFDENTYGTINTFSFIPPSLPSNGFNSLISVQNGSSLKNVGTLSDGGIGMAFYSITLGSYGEFISSQSLASFSSQSNGVIQSNSIITSTILNTYYSLPYRFVADGNVSSTRAGIVPYGDFSNLYKLLGNGQWGTIPFYSLANYGSTGNVNLASTLDSVILDGTALVSGNRVLLKDQTNGVENGIYLVNTSPALATRTIDVPNGSSYGAHSVVINAGTVNSNTIWMCSNVIGSDVVGTNTLTFDSIQTHFRYFSLGSLTYTHLGGTVYLSAIGGGGGGGTGVYSSVSANGETWSGGGGGSGAGIFNYLLPSLTIGQTYPIAVGSGGYGSDVGSFSNTQTWGGTGAPSGIVTSSSTLTGTLSGLNINSRDISTIFGLGTLFTSELAVDDLIYVTGTVETNSANFVFRISSIPNDTQLNIYGGASLYFSTNRFSFSNVTGYKILTGIFAFGGGGGDGAPPPQNVGKGGSGGTNYLPGMNTVTSIGKAGCPTGTFGIDAAYGGVFFAAGAAGGSTSSGTANGTSGYNVYGKFLGGTSTGSAPNYTGGGGGAGFNGTGGSTNGLNQYTSPASQSGAGGAGGAYVITSPPSWVPGGNGGSGFVTLKII